MLTFIRWLSLAFCVLSAINVYYAQNVWMIVFNSFIAGLNLYNFLRLGDVVNATGTKA